MANDAVPLDRKFTLVPKSQEDADEQEVRAIWRGSDPTTWDDIEKEFRSVILAEAGAGKSFEMATRAKLAEGAGKAAFFIRIEDIDRQFEEAFEVGDAVSFGAWLKSDEEAWFYLDSIDEARLDNPQKFEKAIKHFAKKIRHAHQRAHIFISSRPFAWRAKSDRQLIEECLPYQIPKLEATSGVDDSEEIVDELFEEPTTDEKPRSPVKIYLLDPLNKEEIRVYARHRNVVNFDGLIRELERKDLMQLAERPFDLEGVFKKWGNDQTLEGRLELLQYNISSHLQEIEPDGNLRRPISLEKARRGAQRLAAAVILTGKVGIRIPDSRSSQDGVDAGNILYDWEPAEIQTLLERAIFNDVLFGIVRFRHRDVQELLAAEWFESQLTNGNSRRSIENLFFQTQYSCQIIVPRTRPVLPWLILFDEQIRQRSMEIAPEIALEGGDAAHFPLRERKKLLRDVVERIARDDARTIRSNGDIARIAHRDLTNDVQELINSFPDNDDVIFYLGRLVWLGEMTPCLPSLLKFASNPTRGTYARIAAIRAVMSCGNKAQKNQLWQDICDEPEALPRQILTELLSDCDADELTVGFVLKAIAKLEDYNRYEVSGLTRGLHDFINRLPDLQVFPKDRSLFEFAKGLNIVLDKEPHIERRECRVSEKHSWLLGTATHVVERLVSARSEDALTPEVLSILHNIPAAKFWQSENFDEYKNSLSKLVPSWAELNDRLFWYCVDEVRNYRNEKKSERLTDVWQVSWIGHYFGFSSERFDDVICFIKKREFLDDRLVALTLGMTLYFQEKEPEIWREKLREAVVGDSLLEEKLVDLLNPKPSKAQLQHERNEKKRKQKHEKEKFKRIQNRNSWIASLKSDPTQIAQPPQLSGGKIANNHVWLIHELRGDGLIDQRAGASNWQALEATFGADVAASYRDAAMSHWRNYRPNLSSESDDTRSITYALIFGLVGLEIEIKEAPDFPKNLSLGEVTHALRYLTWELNGFPSWVAQMYRHHPNAVMNSVWTELLWELENSKPEQVNNYILYDLVNYASWIHKDLKPKVLNWLQHNDEISVEHLRLLLSLVKSDASDAASICALAQSKIAAGLSKNHSIEILSVWHALLVEKSAGKGLLALEAWLNKLSGEDALHAAQLVVTKLMGTRWNSSTREEQHAPNDVSVLKRLYVLMHQHIRVEEDQERSGKGVYSPNLRDHAQDARNALFNKLSEIPGKQTFIALTELAKEHPVVNRREWMEKLAFQRAEGDGDLEPWTDQQIVEFTQLQVSSPMSHRQLFDQTVLRLLDVKDWLEGGNESPYQTWQRAENETEMRNLVAGRLNDNSQRKFRCAQENEMPNSQRPDIWTQASGIASPVPIELKLLDKHWTGPKLCERLRNQLAGDYLREQGANHGVFLLIAKNLPIQKRWEIDGKRVAIGQLSQALESYWDSISHEYPEVSAIKVVVVDLAARARKSCS